MIDPTKSVEITPPLKRGFKYEKEFAKFPTLKKFRISCTFFGKNMLGYFNTSINVMHKMNKKSKTK